MPASSLVFVAIVVGWAAYLLPRWVVRREALGQSRGRDRHSRRLRVLPRRRGRRATGPSSAPLLGSRSSAAEPAAPIAARRARRPDGSAARAAAARRARVLIVLSALTVLCWVAVALAVLPWQAATPAGGLLVLDLLALTVTGRRRSADRRARARETARRTIRAGQLPGTVSLAGPESATPAERRLADRRRAERRTAERRGATVESAAAEPAPVSPLKPVPARSAPRPSERSWADDLDLDAVLARRRAVNG